MKDIIFKKGFVFLDGAMGTSLRTAVPDYSGIPDILSVTHPGTVEKIHRQYAEAGSEIIYTNTFGASEEKLEGTGITLERLVTAAVENAKKAAGNAAAVALDIGPTGKMMPPMGEMTFDEAYEIFRQKMIFGEKAGADLIVVETMSDLGEARTALLAAKENTALPVFVTMTFGENGRSFAGCSPENFAVLMTSMGADAIGVNCSFGPDQLYPVILEMSRKTDLPLIVKANAGLPSSDGSYSIGPWDFAEKMKRFSEIGVKYLGGCCGTTPQYISCLKEEYAGISLRERNYERKCFIVSQRRCVDADNISIVGERLNPTGKKKLAAALAEGDMDYLVSVAKEEESAGADILDVNVGIPGADEAALMKQVVSAVSTVTDLPLQIDSKSPSAIEAGLRAFPGRAIINSVDGTDETLDSILPLAKKYGSALIGLTIDENGIPASARDRLKIAEKIMKRAVCAGIPKSDIFIDCLTLAVSAEPEGAVQTLEAVRLVRDELGLKTTLGVSNISFGLPEREVIASSFLTLALNSGLTLPIINPSVRRMKDAVFSFRALTGLDRSCMDYVEYMKNVQPGQTTNAESAETRPTDLKKAIVSGDEVLSRRISGALLDNDPSADIINGLIIPALDEVGSKFESGEFFLPQLMRSASAASAAVEVLKSRMENSQTGSESKGKIVLATVRGDIHDIGKNIVKMVLANYGYEIIDLGKDVPKEAVAEAALENDVKLVGLSALMTTTLDSMEETIAYLRSRGYSGYVMVGGAVLTGEYAKEIGADYYAKDAKESADIAKIVFGG
ncbi:MAG: homocysteine S-methyltransferase family protein [Clostridia bacterium]|nr:homocysteine S-methyltransferase family protein [Clostridia bacterium]